MHRSEDRQSMQHEAVQEILKQSPRGTSRHKRSEPFEALRPMRAYGDNRDQYADHCGVNHEVRIIGRLSKLHPFKTLNNVRHSSDMERPVKC